MTDQQIMEGNKMIVQFKGGLTVVASRNMFNKETGTRVIEVSKMKNGCWDDLRDTFHDSWNKLMPLVSQITSLENTSTFDFSELHRGLRQVNIELVFMEVVSFLKWREEQILIDA